MDRLPEFLSNTINTFPLLITLVIILLGIVCIIAGRKFYWLATGLNSFLAAYIAVSTVMVWPVWKYLSAAVVAGLLVALFTIALKKISLTLNSFFIFGLLLTVPVISLFDFGTNSFTPVILFFVVGSIAAFYNLMKPLRALLYTTSFIGAFAIACGIFRLVHRVPNALYITILWAVIGIAGVIWQTHQAAKEEQKSDWG